ncbi:UDP-N-acetylmuramoyl-L-alanyl-D-glutamate--2,6-diaminopimelate ligase [Brevirhabdus pacifica]|uniref:UDP-N-acetylmuramoyl-L-alanyl-D-glutamate--2,6-diaminopimelate ligase n=1 Tax=Brevirhabdus pacifica TaxID=1267768 RepID=A0A1U7DKP7_9RHOB|nr:UDP-N-acetylmuramoyl-L-alanyl-D-glutamate--2,6-diaminopimelate ligase [Brevirhabdus pacifica]APX90551.1 UDP-N-acetylmuramoyl-L-alanyl-D-glutamate--2,6-diaminopimelate ligase [Brevirhabdus pacifica]OWU78448.1 UDP-N-acetylmuramoylalanyl-D-glutamate--2,6-diaminopimelate ligase [Loktanella sp. 22II-4b]PJJ85321.1 UDP-N-acetylmuramoylalanyl-D-glutamate--2,6-diaminopimelate ligase [Brevirhabdus pacifica]
MAVEHSGKRLSELGLAARNGRDVTVTGVSVDSREVKPGHLFVAMPGSQRHGADFITYALRMGAAAVLTDAEGAKIAAEVLAESEAVVIVAQDPRQALAYAAALWFGAQPETMVAVTGTNGKTSVASFVRQIWIALGHQAANLGTTGVEGAFTASTAHTTPEPVTLHRLLAEMAGAGITHAAMEASSHGLEQRRLDGVVLKAGAFTNFSQDHLDYHAGFDEYFAAKAGLFNRVLLEGATGVINLDAQRGREMAAEAEGRGLELITTGRDQAAHLRLTGQRFDATGQEVLFSWQGDAQRVRLELIGGFQAENVLAAAGLVIAAGEEATDVFRALPELVTVRGRMQLAATRENGASVFVDYAHTPDALETALKALRPHVMGRLIVVFGAGGDRDRGKRPLMGAAAAANADVVFITDDNPRSEEPASIRAMVREGAEGAGSSAEITEVGDRAEAILRGVDALQPGDALLIAGKGHETGQIVGDDVFPFDDAEQASVAVAALDGASA